MEKLIIINNMLIRLGGKGHGLCATPIYNFEKQKTLVDCEMSKIAEKALKTYIDSVEEAESLLNIAEFDRSIGRIETYLIRKTDSFTAVADIQKGSDDQQVSDCLVFKFQAAATDTSEKQVVEIAITMTAEENYGYELKEAALAYRMVELLSMKKGEELVSEKNMEEKKSGPLKLNNVCSAHYELKGDVLSRVMDPKIKLRSYNFGQDLTPTEYAEFPFVKFAKMCKDGSDDMTDALKAADVMIEYSKEVTDVVTMNYVYDEDLSANGYFYHMLFLPEGSKELKCNSKVPFVRFLFGKEGEDEDEIFACIDVISRENGFNRKDIARAFCMMEYFIDDYKENHEDFFEISKEENVTDADSKTVDSDPKPADDVNHKSTKDANHKPADNVQSDMQHGIAADVVRRVADDEHRIPEEIKHRMAAGGFESKSEIEDLANEIAGSIKTMIDHLTSEDKTKYPKEIQDVLEVLHVVKNCVNNEENKPHAERKIIELDESNYDQFEYWSNSCGDVYHDGEFLAEDDLPKELLVALKELWNDNSGSMEFLSEYQGEKYVALLNEFHDDCTDEYDLTMDDVYKVMKAHFEKIYSSPEFNHTLLMFGKNTGYDGCHEAVILVPASFANSAEGKRAFRKIENIIYDTCYDLDDTIKELGLDNKKKAENPVRKVIDLSCLDVFESRYLYAADGRLIFGSGEKINAKDLESLRTKLRILISGEDSNNMKLIVKYQDNYYIGLYYDFYNSLADDTNISMNELYDIVECQMKDFCNRPVFDHTILGLGKGTILGLGKGTGIGYEYEVMFLIPVDFADQNETVEQFHKIESLLLKERYDLFSQLKSRMQKKESNIALKDVTEDTLILYGKDDEIDLTLYSDYFGNIRNKNRLPVNVLQAIKDFKLDDCITARYLAVYEGKYYVATQTSFLPEGENNTGKSMKKLYKVLKKTMKKIMREPCFDHMTVLLGSKTVFDNSHEVTVLSPLSEDGPSAEQFCEMENLLYDTLGKTYDSLVAKNLEKTMHLVTYKNVLESKTYVAGIYEEKTDAEKVIKKLERSAGISEVRYCEVPIDSDFLSGQIQPMKWISADTENLW